MIIALIMLLVLFGVGVKITGALMLALVWLFIKLPLALILCCFGFLCCCTIILIPLGKGIAAMGFSLLL